MKLKVKRVITLAALGLVLASPIVAKAGSIAKYGINKSGIWDPWALAYTGSNGGWSEAYVKGYQDVGFGNSVSTTLAYDYDAAGWAQTKSVNYSPYFYDRGAGGYHTTSSETKTSW